MKQASWEKNYQLNIWFPSSLLGECRTKIDAARLLTLNAAKMIDNGGAKNARIEISTASSQRAISL